MSKTGLNLFSVTDESAYTERWQRQLKDIYCAKRGRIGFHPGLTFEKFSSDEYFVDLQLVKEQKSTTEVKQVELETYSDLLRLKDKNDLTHVLVSGEAGMGKTTMISRLAYQWATEKRPTKSSKKSAKHKKSKKDNRKDFDKLEYVFVLDLRKCEPGMCLVDAIESQLLSNVSKPHLEEFLTNHASDCLYLFDGYDEMSSNDMVLNSSLLCSSHVIVTTRPNKVITFIEKHNEYVQVISNGFSYVSIERFVKKYFANSEEISEALLAAIDSNPVVRTLARFPLLLAMICVIWKNNNSFPNSVSELFHQTIEYLARHWKDREQKFESMSFKEFKNHNKFDQILVNIGKTALHGLLQDSKLIFKDDEFDSSEAVDQGCSLGIMSKDSKVSGFDTMTYISFVHKTFQEYCASLYLSNIADSENQQSLNSYLSQMNISEMEYVLRFCCGTSQKAAEFVLTYIVDVVKNETQNDPITSSILKQICTLPLVLLYEAESKFGVIDSLHTILSPAVVNINMYIDDHNDDPAYEAALQYFIDKFDTQTVWTEQVQMAELYHRPRYEVYM